MAQQAERVLVVPTREPDLDNANVGSSASPQGGREMNE